jgi:hypothetical protein
VLHDLACFEENVYFAFQREGIVSPSIHDRIGKEHRWIGIYRIPARLSYIIILISS